MKNFKIQEKIISIIPSFVSLTFPLSLPVLSFVRSLPPLLSLWGLTKETWLSQRPAADLLIHSLWPFYVLLQTYLQRGKRRRVEGDKDLKSGRVTATLSCIEVG